MKSLRVLLILFVGLFTVAPAQTIEVLYKGEYYNPPLNEMVVMDKYTFGKYHYTAEKYDTLKREVVELDRAIIERDSVQAALTADYEKTIAEKNKEAQVYKLGYEDMGEQLQKSVSKNEQLLIDYKKLEQKRQRTKRWRNIFLGSTAISTGILILLIVI